MREPQVQSYVTHRPRGHVANKKRYIFTFTRPMGPKLSRLRGLRMRGPHPQGHKVLNQDEGGCQNDMSPQPQGYRDVKGKLVLAKNKHKNTN